MLNKLIHFDASDHPGVFECASVKYFVNLFLNIEKIKDVGKLLGFNVGIFPYAIFPKKSTIATFL